MFIAVGDQRRKRVHMVRVLYHRDLIRLKRKKEERENKVFLVCIIIRIVLQVCQEPTKCYAIKPSLLTPLQPQACVQHSEV